MGEGFEIHNIPETSDICIQDSAPRPLLETLEIRILDNYPFGWD